MPSPIPGPEDAFIRGWNTIAQAVNSLARSNGFWTWPNPDLDPKIETTVKLCLIHSEISEAMEAVRLGKDFDDKLPHSALGVELADAVIRIMDLATQRGIPLAQIIIDKHRYNSSRPFRHGGKAF